MPGPFIPDPTPAWLKPENASVTDTALAKAMRMIGHLIGADNPTAQVLGLMMSDVPSSGEVGGLSKAVEGLKARVIKAYHGSPHDYAAERLIQHANGQTEYIVGRPDVLPDVPLGAKVLRDFPLGRQRLDKIGTGEGAQAYGHGLYQAGGEGTAEYYRKELSPRGRYALQVNGERLSFRDAAKRALGDKTGEDLATYYESGDAVRRDQRDQMSVLSGLGEALKKQGHRVEYTPTGRMYEVAIHADPEDFLDWDKPLSQQSEKVKAALEAAGIKQRTAEEMDLLKYDYAKRFYEKPYFHLNDIEKQEVLRAVEANRVETGAAAYRKAGTATPAEATSKLQQAGIPGIKYLDQGSRAAGEGSRNYVVFDDRLIDILKKYGLLLPAAGAATQGQTLISPRGEQ